MANYFKVFIACAALLIQSALFAQEERSSKYAQNNGLIEDDKIYEHILSETRQLINQGKATSVSKLIAQLNRSDAPLSLKAPNKKPIDIPTLYKTCKPGVMVIGTIFKCGHCPNDHIRAASGFSISEDGVCVTSYHVFQGNATDEKNELTHVAMDSDGNVFPITAILAADKRDDIAIIKVDTGGKKLVALPLGPNPSVGEEAFVIAHPHSMFYSLTQGMVSRIYLRDGGEKMSITADFGQGSSGGPVFDEKGNIIGVVSATLSLYNSDNNLQMVSKETIPVQRIRALIK